MLNLKKLLTKILVLLKTQIIAETAALTFTSGSATLAAKTGYKLVSVYPYNRSDASYGITDWTEQTNGSYVLKNKYTSLSASLVVRVIWVKVS